MLSETGRKRTLPHADHEQCRACPLARDGRQCYVAAIAPAVRPAARYGVMILALDDWRAARSFRWPVTPVLVPAVRCTAATYSMAAVRHCRQFLAASIGAVTAKYGTCPIFAFGDLAWRAAIGKAPGARRDVAWRLTETDLGPVWLLPSLTDSTQWRQINILLAHASQDSWDPEPGPVSGTALALDTEFSSKDAKLLTVAVSDGTHAVAVEDTFDAAWDLLRNASDVIGHYLSVDLDWAVRAGVAKPEWLRGEHVFDTYLLAKHADENRGASGYGLEGLVASYLGHRAWKDDTEQYGENPLDWPPALRQQRCRVDAYTTWQLYQAVKPYVQGPWRLTHRIAATLHRAELAGLCVSVPLFEQHRRELVQRLSDLSRVLEDHAARYGVAGWSPTNDQKIRELLYDKLGVVPPSKTATGRASVDKISLRKLLGTPAGEVVQTLLDHAAVEKICSVYLDNIARLGTQIRTEHGDAYWLPVMLRPLGARTGRRSSGGGINYQNWPKSVRKLVVSRFQSGVMADNDYRQLEVLLMGYCANEPKLIEYFTTSPNGYIEIGTRLFGKTVEKSSPDYRVIKSIVLGVQYCLSGPGLAKQLWDVAGIRLADSYAAHRMRAEALREKYLRMFPGIRRFQEKRIAEVHATGQVVGALGQIRRLPTPPEPPRSETQAYAEWKRAVAHLEHEACNFPIQWLASLVTGAAAVDVEDMLLQRYGMTLAEYHARLLERAWPNMPILCLEIHDDLVYDVPATETAMLAEIREVMSHSPTIRRLIPDFSVPLSVETSVSAQWGAT